MPPKVNSFLCWVSNEAILTCVNLKSYGVTVEERCRPIPCVVLVRVCQRSLECDGMEEQAKTFLLG